MGVKWKKIFLISTVLILCVMSGYNIYVYKCDFFKANISQVLTLGITAFFAFFMTQMYADRRIQKDIVVKVLESIQSNTENEKAYNVQNEADVYLLKINKRSLNNSIYRIEKYSKKLGIECEVDIMRTHFNEYEKFFGDHEADVNYLSKSEAELRKSLELINGTAFDIMIKIYD